MSYRNKPSRLYALAGGILLSLPSAAAAHAYRVVYTLPMPLWLYSYGCAAVLVISFFLIYLLGKSDRTSSTRFLTLPRRDGPRHLLPQWTLSILRLGALCSLIIAVVAGFIGNQDPAVNINMTMFWILFLSLFTYATVFIGDVYALINPIAFVVQLMVWSGVAMNVERIAYPKRLAYYPALAFYVLFLWLELFTLPSPRILSISLSCYVFIGLCGSWGFGRDKWLRYGDFFGVFFRMVGLLAPVRYWIISPFAVEAIYYRQPLTATANQHTEQLSLVLFILFMLSSTSYDGIHDTSLWIGLYWRNILPFMTSAWSGPSWNGAFPAFDGYLTYQRLGLLFAPILYFAIYWAFQTWTRTIVNRTASTRELVCRFAFTFIPIAVAYNFTHYFTWVLSTVPDLPFILSDPFGWGWNILRLSGAPAPSMPLPMAVVWHIQVATLLIGHVSAVWLSHLVALRVFPSERQAAASQVPMLILTIVHTTIGLGLLALPMAAPR